MAGDRSYPLTPECGIVDPEERSGMADPDDDVTADLAEEEIERARGEERELEERRRRQDTLDATARATTNAELDAAEAYRLAHLAELDSRRHRDLAELDQQHERSVAAEHEARVADGQAIAADEYAARARHRRREAELKRKRAQHVSAEPDLGLGD
ncbi:hypothetical protein [Kribbella sp. NPDC055071]